MKKLMLSLMSLSVLSAPVSAIVSCGNKVQDPEKTLITTFSANPNNWVTAQSMRAWDFEFLANTNANPLSTDQYGREYGDLFEPVDYKKDNKVGTESNSSKTWVYKLRSNATWSDYKGNKVSDITVNDFLNTAKYVLNPSNNAEVYPLWAEFIKGAAEIYNLANKPSANFDEIFESNKSKLGLKVNESTREVTFELEKSAPYFETLLTYSVFSPIHSQVLVDSTINKDYRKGYYSGAFVPSEYVQDSKMVLDKNQNYHFADKTNLDRVRYLFNKGPASTSRELYKAGTINSFTLNANDASGWSQYVGEEVSAPKKTPGMVKYTDSPNTVSSMALYFNYLNSEYLSGSADDKARTLNSSRLLQYSKTREFIASALDRTKFVTYYSKPYDKGHENISSQLRNTYVPGEGFVSDETGKSYQDIFANSYNKILSPESSVKGSDLADGVDFLRNRVYGEQVVNDKNQLKVARQKKAQELKSEVIDKDEVLKKASGKIKLIALQNPVLSNTSGKYLHDMYTEFNEIPDNPIEIVEKTPTTDTEYNQLKSNGKMDLEFSGWSPDYADPMTYLGTIKLGGDLDLYIGLSRLFNFQTYEDIKGDGDAKKAYESLKSKNKEEFEKIVVEDETGVSDLFVDRFNFTKNLEDYDKNNVDTSKSSVRYSKLSELEVETLYKDTFMLPVYRSAPAMTFSISPSTPFRLSRTGYGTSQYKLFNYNFDKTKLSYEEIEKLREEYLAKKEEVSKDKTKYQDPDIWS
ncbi:oligopeptide ABC transporter substrate-binding protein [Spiroplasma litorale]|uniref:Oligopeptide ABC transporter substrate-binding protein n=1 Tax=Spiroplasma litorale TaxID=216942 RepID=A0A0K1W1U5_9MOLU|nr:ABC transporter substrate-binding protein [Spiroplasma litorale]AKX34077.1 oligopeptide ABC transporter substrate-binding protein [Spiroplasma litorale]